VNPRAWGLMWATVSGALVAVPETEPGWLWAAGHVVSSVLLAYLVVALLDQVVMRVLYALARGSGAWGQVTVTSEPEPGSQSPGLYQPHRDLAGLGVPALPDPMLWSPDAVPARPQPGSGQPRADLERLEDRSVDLLARVGTLAAEIALIRARYAHLNRRPEA
jgi:hypothetical protein